MVRSTLDYVLREMTSTDGAFWSATDADSEGVEGKFFVWTADELRALLDRLLSITGTVRAQSDVLACNARALMSRRAALEAQLLRFGGNISRTANFVGMERSALHRKLKFLGVHADDRAPAAAPSV